MIAAFFKTEWAKLRGMSFRDKRQYIWEYYKLQIFIFAFAAFIVGSLINVWFINPPKREYLYVAWLSPQPILSTQIDRIGHALDVIVSDPGRYQVVVSSYSATDIPEIDMALRSRFAALLSTGSIDIFLTNREGMLGLAENSFIRPISPVMEEIQNPEFYTYLNSRILTITFAPEDSDQVTQPMAISLAGSPLFRYLEIDTTDLYLAMVINSGKFYEISKALEAIFGLLPEVVYDS